MSEKKSDLKSFLGYWLIFDTTFQFILFLIVLIVFLPIISGKSKLSGFEGLIFYFYPIIFSFLQLISNLINLKFSKEFKKARQIIFFVHGFIILFPILLLASFSSSFAFSSQFSIQIWTLFTIIFFIQSALMILFYPMLTLYNLYRNFETKNP